MRPVLGRRGKSRLQIKGIHASKFLVRCPEISKMQSGWTVDREPRRVCSSSATASAAKLLLFQPCRLGRLESRRACGGVVCLPLVAGFIRRRTSKNKSKIKTMWPVQRAYSRFYSLQGQDYAELSGESLANCAETIGQEDTTERWYCSFRLTYSHTSR